MGRIAVSLYGAPRAAGQDLIQRLRCIVYEFMCSSSV